MNSLRNIIKAINFYTSKGFTYIETPWIVDKGISEMTMPVGANPFKLLDGRTLVGSAENGFLQLILNDQLPRGKYCSFSPCFRDDTIDEIHHKWFYKLELIQTCNVDSESLQNMISLAKEFFTSQGLDVEIVKTEIGFDLVSKDIELGSYGIRSIGNSCKNCAWIYGTGCAEPRMTQVKECKNEIKDRLAKK